MSEEKKKAPETFDEVSSAVESGDFEAVAEVKGLRIVSVKPNERTYDYLGQRFTCKVKIETPKIVDEAQSAPLATKPESPAAIAHAALTPHHDPEKTSEMPAVVVNDETVKPVETEREKS